MGKVVLLCAGSMLAGCVTAQEQAARINAEHHAKGISFGAKAGTPTYTQCRLELDRRYAAAREARIAAQQQAIVSLIAGAAAAATSRPAPAAPVDSPRQPTACWNYGTWMQCY